MPNPNGSNDSMDQVDQIHDIIQRYTVELRRELASRDLRIENLQRAFDEMFARAVAAEKAASDSEAWLTKVRRVISDAGLVRGDYEASVRALVVDAKRALELERQLLELRATPKVLVERTLYDVEQASNRNLQQQRDQALALLRRHMGLRDTEQELRSQTHDFLMEHVDAVE